MSAAKGYKFAVELIALNDNPGDNEGLDILESYATVGLAAAIYGKSQDRVARDVFNYRNPVTGLAKGDTVEHDGEVTWYVVNIDKRSGEILIERKRPDLSDHQREQRCVMVNEIKWRIPEAQAPI